MIQPTQRTLPIATSTPCCLGVTERIDNPSATAPATQIATTLMTTASIVNAITRVTRPAYWGLTTAPSRGPGSAPLPGAGSSPVPGPGSAITAPAGSRRGGAALGRTAAAPERGE